MSPNLRRGHNPALRLYRPPPQQRLPVRLAGPQRKRTGIRENLRRALIPRALGPRLRQRDCRLGEPQVKADEAADPADGRVKRRGELRTRLYGVTFLEVGVVKDVELVVGCGLDDLACRRDVEGSVEQLAR